MGAMVTVSREDYAAPRAAAEEPPIVSAYGQVMAEPGVALDVAIDDPA